MGNCKYCGKPAGLFRSQHADCAEKSNRGWSEMLAVVSDAANGRLQLDSVEPKLAELAKSSFIQPNRVRDALIQGWGKTVEQFLDDGILSKDEETKLVSLRDKFSLSEAELDRGGAYSKVVKAAVLRDLMDGKLPSRLNIQGQLPFNFQKNEQIVWLFNDVSYLEDKTRTSFVGASSGVSVRIAKGLYYRAGVFKGHPVQSTERVQVDKGGMVATDKHIYFAGPKKSFKVPYAKIVTFIPYTDGIGIMRDAANAKQQVFATGDGWFTYNLIKNLSQL